MLIFLTDKNLNLSIDQANSSFHNLNFLSYPVKAFLYIIAVRLDLSKL